jgi:propionyl-CoA carboxylase alpha chain
MRIVENESGLKESLEGARREAASSFGDDTVFLEKWLDNARHVEIQILGDRHGNLVHCFERECSIQRRHQKIIEEAPSPAVTDEIREKMGQAAIAAAKKIGYHSAGTVEFMLSGNDFWFLEVNARLQVEHPVTEEIIGHDLVREQIRVAEGEALSFTQDDLAIDGHAIEARLYAEDPTAGFLPSPGPVVAWEPSTTGKARFDSGIEAGNDISLDFDPMIAKVIVHAPTRREAASRLARVLESTRVQGLVTNRDFLVATLRTPEFLAGDTTTDFIDRVDPPRTREATRSELLEACIATIIEGQARRRGRAKVLTSMPSGWRNSYMPLEQITFGIGDDDIALQYRSRRDGKFRVLVDDREMLVTPYSGGNGSVDVDIDGHRQIFKVDNIADTWLVHGAGGDLALTQRPRYPVPGLGDISGGMTAPMPGVVLATEVKAGDSVSKGQLLLILEAMKMEHRITAPGPGTISELHVSVGEQVANGQLLVTLAEEEGDK